MIFEGKEQINSSIFRSVYVEAAKNVSDIISSNSNPKEEMFRDAFNKVQNSDSNRDFGTTKAAKVYFSMSEPGPNEFAKGKTHAPSFK